MCECAANFYVMNTWLLHNIILQRKWTPLHIAAQNGQIEVLESLIKSEADISAFTEVKQFATQ